MTLSLHPAFTLVLDDDIAEPVFRAADWQENSCSLTELCEKTAGISFIDKATSIDKTPTHVVIDYPSLRDKASAIVAIIQCLLGCAQANLPVCLNRTGQVTLADDIPNAFAVGFETSGTTGTPKLVWQTAAHILPKQQQPTTFTRHWLLTYHPLSFAGIQVLLQALVNGDRLSVALDNTPAQLAKTSVAHQITSLSVTPSSFKSLMLCWQALPPLQEITFGGEIAEQDVLDLAGETFPDGHIRHIYATSESGVIFSVKDRQAGFPQHWLSKTFAGWQLSVVNDELTLTHGETVISTGDKVVVQQKRVLFAGRDCHTVNVAGVKVDLESIERSLIALPDIADARIYAKPNPLIGNMLHVQIVAKPNRLEAAQAAFTQWQAALPKTNQPRFCEWVSQLSLNENQKKVRICS
jgi:acyl-coenzyme A synthetase/AMP-(fatty) acid ligase